MVEVVHAAVGGRTYQLTDDPSAVDRDSAWNFLSTQAYWARWRQRADFEQQLDSAWRAVSAHCDTGQVGFARAVSDGVAIAYLADVFVAEDARGQGVARAMLRLMIEHGPGAEFRWMLHTKDAHELYREFGFVDPDDRFLERPPTR